MGIGRDANDRDCMRRAVGFLLRLYRSRGHPIYVWSGLKPSDQATATLTVSRIVPGIPMTELCTDVAVCTADPSPEASRLLRVHFELKRRRHLCLWLEGNLGFLRFPFPGRISRLVRRTCPSRSTVPVPQDPRSMVMAFLVTLSPMPGCSCR